MNLKEIKEMIALMDEHNLTELELEREGLKIKLKRGGLSQTGGGNIIIDRISQMDQLSQASNQSQAAMNTAAQPAPAPAKAEKMYSEIKSPMVGTFYRAPSPDAAAFVEIGSQVEIGQVICIIEAMKLMNEIKSEVKGIIKEVLAENADPIEFGQVLFKIEPR